MVFGFIVWRSKKKKKLMSVGRLSRQSKKRENESKISPPCTCTLASRAAPNFSTAASKSPACWCDEKVEREVGGRGEKC